MMTATDNAGRSSFTELQYAFTRHLRDPAHAPAPADVEDRRMQIYRDLLYNNVESFIANSFPVIRTITGDAAWHAMIRDYFKRHLARTPLFPKMPQEFLQYLQEERDGADDPPFLVELAHYEWVELALSLDGREIVLDGIDPDGDLLAKRPLLSPLVWPLAYRFPVHRISPEYQPAAAPSQPTYLVVYRDDNDDIGFLELNPVAARLLELLADDQQDTSGREMLEQIAAELGHADPAKVVTAGAEILASMLDKDIIIGTRAS